MGNEQTLNKSGYVSSLQAKPDQLVAQLLSASIAGRWRNPNAFLEQFSASALVEALQDHRDLRVRLLVKTTGTKAKIAAKKTAMSASEDLQLALDEDDTTVQDVLELFSPDEWVQVLGAQPLWNFMTGGPFIDQPEPQKNVLPKVLVILEEALSIGLLSEGKLCDAIGIDALTLGLKDKQLRTIMKRALERGRKGKTFTERELLREVPLERLLPSVPLSRIWSEVVLPHIAGPARLVEKAEGSGSDASAGGKLSKSVNGKSKGATAKPAGAESNAPSPSAPPAVARARTLDKAPGVTGTASSPPAADGDSKSAPPPATAAQPSPGGSLPAPPGPFTADTEEVVSSSPPPSLSSAPPRAASPPSDAPPASVRPSPQPPPLTGQGSEPQRSVAPPPPQRSAAPPPPQRNGGGTAKTQDASDVRARLARLQRLPSNYNELPSTVLLSIESMYTELQTTSDAQEQLTIIQDSFPNEHWRGQAMLALLGLLDPATVQSTPTLQDESPDSLTIRLLTEERQRALSSVAPSAPPPRTSSAPAPAGANHASFAPPPAAAPPNPDFGNMTMAHGSPPAQVSAPPAAVQSSGPPPPPPRRSGPPPLPFRAK